MVDVFTLMLGKKMIKMVIKNSMVRFSWPEEVTLTEVYKAFSLIKMKKDKILSICKSRRSRHPRVLGTKLDFTSAVTSGCLMVEWIDDDLHEDATWILHPDWDYSKRTTTPWVPIAVFMAAVSKITPIGVSGNEPSGHFTYD